MSDFASELKSTKMMAPATNGRKLSKELVRNRFYAYSTAKVENPRRAHACREAELGFGEKMCGGMKAKGLSNTKLNGPLINMVIIIFRTSYGHFQSF